MIFRPGFLQRIGLLLCAAFALVPADTFAQAQTTIVPKSQAQIRLSYAPIVKRAAPAVVNVYVRRLVRQRVSPFFNDPFFRRFFGNGFGAPRRREQNSLGSGVIVSPDGVVVTNHHVIKGGGDGEVKIAFADKREYPARIILKDEKTDLAILRLDAPGVTFPYLEFENSEGLNVGDLVLAIGNPFGVGQTVTSGIVSALARTRVGVSDYQFFIQTDAAINPGNSGGALIDMNGRLVGVNTAIYSRSGGSLGIGFAIPSNMVRLVVQSALQGKHVKRPWFGAKLQALTSDIAESLGVDRPAGALVQKLHKASPAAKAGLRSGDVIIAVNGKPVADPRAFHYRFSTKGIGGKASLEIVRDGRKVGLAVPLVEAPEDPPRDTRELKGSHPFSGATVANLSPALSEELSVNGDDRGVIILDIRRGTPAGSIGFLRDGDIVIAVNGARVRDVKQLEKLVTNPAGQWRLSVKRRGRILNVVISG
ncbi:MAG: Do family serine endopeptidase [Hyphomicrobiales bacterium]|nr:Do family serine endopeptidase [Hyphomicrobiales bacterium]